MLTFNDLMIDGVAMRTYTNFIPSKPMEDAVVRMYNNSYGVFTDTHMSRLDAGEYVITGSLVRDVALFDSFLHSTSFGLGTFFRPNGGEPTALVDFLKNNGLVGSYSTLNGDSVFIITPAFAMPDNVSVDMTSERANHVRTPLNTLEKTSIFGTRDYSGLISRIANESEDVIMFAEKLNECETCAVNDFKVNGRSDKFQLYSPEMNVAITFNKEQITEEK